MTWIIAVDPGDAHVGVAEWENGAICAREVPANEFLKQFAVMAPYRDLAIVEDFRLYPSKASAQSYSQMKTAKMIGAMEWIADCAMLPIALQSASIKIPTRQQCGARGIDVINRSTHASDALLHLHYYLLRNNLEVSCLSQ